jgi:hypothetical protein
LAQLNAEISSLLTRDGDPVPRYIACFDVQGELLGPFTAEQYPARSTTHR